MLAFSWPHENQRNPARPEAGAYGAYPAGYRKKHHTAPPMVQWMSGVLSDAGLQLRFHASRGREHGPKAACAAVLRTLPAGKQ